MRKIQNSRDVENLRAALMYNAEGYRLLTQAGRDEDEFNPVSMVKNKKRAALFFKMFTQYVQKIENIEQTAKDLQRKYGNIYQHTTEYINNQMYLNGYILQK